MDDDCLRLVLRYVCLKRVKDNTTKLQASLATGEDCTVFDIQEPFLTCDGVIGPLYTILFLEDMQTHPNPYGKVLRTSDLYKICDLKKYDLCLQDNVSVYSHEYGDMGELSACLGWGQAKRVFYKIELSQSLKVSVAFDTVQVPTSWWANEFEGAYWGVQMHPADEVPIQIVVEEPVCGYEIVGFSK